MRNRNILGAGLAATAFGLTGCYETTSGTSVSAGTGECVPMSTSFKLAPHKRVFVGGDVQFGGNHSSDLRDRLEILNNGNRQLHIDRDGDDNGVLTLLSGVQLPSADADTSINYTVAESDKSSFLTYVENKTSFTFAAQAIANQVIELDVSVRCD